MITLLSGVAARLLGALSRLRCPDSGNDFAGEIAFASPNRIWYRSSLAESTIQYATSYYHHLAGSLAMVLGFNARGGTRLEANRSAAVTFVVDYIENGFQYHFELAMFCPFYLCPRLQTFKQAEIRYGKVPPGRRDVVISVPHRTSLVG